MGLALVLTSSLVFWISAVSAEFAWLNWLSPESHWRPEPTSFEWLLSQHTADALFFSVPLALSVVLAWPLLNNLSWFRLVGAGVGSGVASFTLIDALIHLDPKGWVGWLTFALAIVGIPLLMRASLRFFGSPAKSRFERRTRQFLAITFGLFALAFAVRVYSFTHNLDGPFQHAFQEFRTSSSLARWWRCQGISRPLLAKDTR